MRLSQIRSVCCALIGAAVLIQSAVSAAENTSSSDISYSSNPVQEKFLLAKNAYFERNFGRALDLFESCLKAEPTNVDYICWLAQTKAQAMDEKFRKGSSNLSLIGIGRDINNLYKKALDIEPDNTRALIASALFFRLTPGLLGGSDQKAEEMLLSLSKEHPENMFVWHELGMLYRKDLNDEKKATECYLKAIEVAQEDSLNDEEKVFLPRSYYGIGSIYLKQKKYEKAVPYLEKSTENNANLVECWIDLAEAYRNTGQEDKAKKALRDAARIHQQCDYKKFKRDILTVAKELDIRNEIREKYDM